MRRFSKILFRYVLQAVLPYFAVAWLLLSVILFVHEASRRSDILLSTAIPNDLVWQLAIALVPNVIAFTCPIAALIGVIIGLSRMQGDSEMVAIRAAGVGNIQIIVPILMLGILLSLFAFFVNLTGVPFAAKRVRQVLLQAALHKLESPIDPGIFNTDIDSFTIYVRRGNLEKGTWEDLFIRQESKDQQQVRLITAGEGRIDTKEDDTEIVLSNAIVTTLDKTGKNKIASEKFKELRLAVQTKRGEIIKKLTAAEKSPEEMGLVELSQYAKTIGGRKGVDAHILWQRRILLSITPLLFTLLGAGLVLKFNHGGRGVGIFLALISLGFYYSLTLMGEQLARTGAISVLMAALIPLITTSAVTVWLFLTQRLSIAGSFSVFAFPKSLRSTKKDNKVSAKNTYIDLTTGLLDFDLIWTLLANYIVTSAFLIMIYIVFTAFELWKFAGAMDNGVSLLVTYLFFLVPFIYIQLAPSSLMIATLATYIIKSRQNEIVSWTAAGQSVYRLLLPCFALMGAIGLVNFALQELVLTKANRAQDTLRAQIRSRNSTIDKNGKHWVASESRIFSFEAESASDNEVKFVKNPVTYEFSSDFTLKSIIKADSAEWGNTKITYLPLATKSVLNGEAITTLLLPKFKLDATQNPFKQTITQPKHLDIFETARKARETNSEIEKRKYLIALQKKYSTPFLPFIIVLFTAPFALTLSRKGTVVTLGYAVAIWLLFMGVNSAFEQFGSNGFISPSLAIWSPLLLFTMLGVYLMTRIRT